MRYSLRTLLIVMLLAPPALAALWRFRNVHLVETSVLLLFLVIGFYVFMLVAKGFGWLTSMLITSADRLVKSIIGSSE